LRAEALELDDLLRIEPLEELAIAHRIRGDRGVHDLEPLIRELDDDSATIVLICQATDDPRRSSRSMRLVTPAEESMSPLPGAVESR
jgi:hypothetical protein